MMKMSMNMIRSILLVAAFAAGGVAQAAELKIGVVIAAKVMQDAPQAESARAKIEREFAPRDKKIVEMQRELQSMEEKIGRDAAVMSEEQRQRLERDILALKRDAKRAQEEFRDDLNIRRNEEFGKLQREILTVINALAEEEGYDLILSEGVIFASGKVDLSQKVIDRLKKTPQESPAPAKK